MALTREQSQTRFLAILLPALTLCTHALLALSFTLPGTSPHRAFWSLLYNALAAGASILGLIGAVRLHPSLISAYTFAHTCTLSFVTLALVNIILPFGSGLLNPVLPSWHVDESAICRDIDAGLGWDEEWLVKCSRNFFTIMSVVAWGGLVLMVAQWWALWTVRKWGREISGMRLRGDVEKGGEVMRDVKT